MGEREQKRLYDLQAPPHGVPTSRVWEYYLLGGSREQLAVYHGRDSVGGACTVPGPNVFMYPVEYNTYNGSTTNLTTLPDAVLPSGVKRYKVADHLGSVRVVLDGSGVPVDSIDYEPFGKALASSGQRLSYIGKEQDKESGLGDFGVRRDDAVIGRFLSPDPMWERFRNQTPYNYADNNPINIKDPNGDCPICALEALGEAIIWALGATTATVATVEVAKHVEAPNLSMPSTESSSSSFPTTTIIGPKGSLTVPSEYLANPFSAYIAIHALNSESEGPVEPDPIGPGSSETGAKSPQKPAYPDDPTVAPGEGWEWRGKGEVGSSKGSWYNPDTGESLHPDLDHPEPIGPHYDYKDPEGGQWRLMPDGSMNPK